LYAKVVRQLTDDQRLITHLKISNFAKNPQSPAKAGVHLEPWETWIPAGVYPREDGGGNEGSMDR